MFREDKVFFNYLLNNYADLVPNFYLDDIEKNKQCAQILLWYFSKILDKYPFQWESNLVQIKEQKIMRVYFWVELSSQIILDISNINFLESFLQYIWLSEINKDYKMKKDSFLFENDENYFVVLIAYYYPLYCGGFEEHAQISYYDGMLRIPKKIVSDDIQISLNTKNYKNIYTKIVDKYVSYWDKLYYSYSDGTKKEVNNFLVKDLKIKSGGFISNWKDVLYNQIIFKDADIDTFEPYNSGWNEYYSYYCFDKNQVFYNWKKIIWANPCFFKVDIDDDSYWIDDESVFYNWEKIPNSHGPTFQLLWNWVYKDQNQRYFNGEIIYLDKNFDTIWSDYHIEKNDVFYKEKILLWADIETFKALSDYYACDKKHIFYKQNILEWADVESFMILKNYYSCDKHYVWHEDRLLIWVKSEDFTL